jgi:hypothetical protein
MGSPLTLDAIATGVRAARPVWGICTDANGLNVSVPIGNDGTNGRFSGWGTAYDDTVLGSAVPSIGTTFVAHVYGVVRTGATAGNLTPRFRSETNGTTVSVKTYSWGSVSAA